MTDFKVNKNPLYPQRTSALVSEVGSTEYRCTFKLCNVHFWLVYSLHNTCSLKFNCWHVSKTILITRRTKKSFTLFLSIVAYHSGKTKLQRNIICSRNSQKFIEHWLLKEKDTAPSSTINLFSFFNIFISRERYTVYVAGNPIYCDCNLVNFLNETQDLLGDKNTAFCDSPHSYAGVSVQNLFIDECCFWETFYSFDFGESAGSFF